MSDLAWRYYPPLNSTLTISWPSDVLMGHPGIPDNIFSPVAVGMAHLHYTLTLLVSNQLFIYLMFLDDQERLVQVPN